MSEKKGLPANAFTEIPEGQEYQPYVSKQESLTEFSIKALIVGSLFGIVFGAANAYLGLKVGLTVSTSIPIAVMTVALFRAMQKVIGKATILETNMSQTIGSASSSLAAGIIFTIPALFLWNLNPPLLQLTALALCGGLLGVLAMIPLRRLLMKGEHGKLPYPEGTACAEILVASEVGGSKASRVFAGLGIGLVYTFLLSGLHLWKKKIWVNIPGISKGMFSLSMTPALLGVGYIIGIRIAGFMLAGSLLSWVVIIPLMNKFGFSADLPFFPEKINLIKDMAPKEIWTNYIRYIGAGAVAAGGIITIFRSFPTIIKSFAIVEKEIKHVFNKKLKLEKVFRTDKDIPLHYALVIVLLVVVAIIVLPLILGSHTTLAIRIVSAICIAICAFFFVTVSSRIVGLVGVSTNPTSGMTIATLILTSTAFYFLGWTDIYGKATALTVGTIVCIASSIAGDASQDLKTGYLLGATPFKQQIGELVGVLTAAVFVCLSVMVLHKAYGFGTPELPAPQATLMKIVIEGVLSANIPWELVMIGVVCAVIAELMGVPSLPFAVGMYLPIYINGTIFAGGLIRYFVEKFCKNKKQLEEKRECGVLYCSGLVAGEGLVGVGIAFWAGLYGKPKGIGMEWLGEWTMLFSLLMFGALIWTVFRATKVAAK